MDKPHLRRFSWYRSGFAHEPDRPSDGTKVDAGLVETVDLTGLDNGTLYYIRIFPYNEKKQYQTLIDGATTSATPNIGPAQVTNFQVTGSGASPVLTWTNPTDDPLYHETVVIQKVGSAPTSITDGTEIYRGTGTTVTATDLVRLEEYYWGVFTVDEAGSYRSPVTSEMYSYDFPDQPASENDYTEISTVYESGTFVVPEDGWFKVVVTGRGTAGTSCSLDSCHYNIKWIGCSAGDGGQAGGAAISIFQFFKGEEIPYTISGNSASFKDMRGTGTTASGGNVGNYTGNAGSRGTKNSGIGYDSGYVAGGAGGSGPTAYNPRGGNGESVSGSNWEEDKDDPSDSGFRTACPSGDTSPAANFIKFFRGNTNVPSPTTVSALSLTPRNASIEANWTNSEDPESVGTMVVVNSDHEPATPEDGTSVDVAEATSYTVTDLPNNKPSYISLFAYNADKTKYSAARSDVEIPREVTWYDVQEDLEADIVDAQEKAEQAQEVVILTRDFLSDTLALTFPEIYDEWHPDSVSYIGKDTATEDKPASIVRYNDALYRCLQSHTSQASWTPEASPSLWVLIDDPAIEWPEWKQPTGAHDAYDLNAKVSHNGKKWISQIAANTTEPGADERYWKEYTE